MLVELLAVMRKELRQAFRDKRMAAMLLLVPVVQLVVLGYAVDLDVDEIPTVVCDQDHTPSSRELVQQLLADHTFALAGQTSDARQALEMLQKGQAAVAIVLPRGLARDLSRDDTSQVQILIDGTDPNRAQIASATATQIVSRAASKRMTEQLERVSMQRNLAASAPQVRLLPRVYYNPSLRSATYMVPGVAAMVLLVITTIVTAMGIAREREMGTLEQLLVTPLRPYVLLLGKCLPFAAIGLVDVAAILTVGSYLFDMPIRGSLLLVFAGTLLYLLSTLGAGVLISTMSTSQQQAILGGFFFLMPAILLSGFMTPIDNMPWWIRPITYLNPVRYFVEILRAVLLKAAGFSDVAGQFAALALFGIGTITVSALRFRKQAA